jgi:hypothetical protein
LHSAIISILGLDRGKDWTAMRRDLTDAQISEIYDLYEGLWPLETDLLQLLPKPDGRPRAVYVGSIHPQAIAEFALAAPLYFGELIIQTPFIHNGTVADKFKPVLHPKNYRQEFLKTILFFLTVMPLVEMGLVNLIPDPCDFDFHLRRQMMSMAEDRAPWLAAEMDKEVRALALAKEDMNRGLTSLPRDTLKAQIKRAMPELAESELEQALAGMQTLRERDPLAVLTDDNFSRDEGSGLFNFMKLAPNFEIAMYLAQAMGASLVTDSPVRWNEFRRAMRFQSGKPPFVLSDLARKIGDETFGFPSGLPEILKLSAEAKLTGYPVLFRDAYKYLPTLKARAPRANVEANLAARFSKVHGMAQGAIAKQPGYTSMGRIKALFPAHGIQDNTVNRLLLMSSSEHHLPHVPMAFFIERMPSNAP